MLGKLSQFKNFIAHAVTSLQSQKPLTPNDPELDSKLRFMLDYILRNPTQGQFKAYHSLQTPEITLNEILNQIYHSDSTDTSQISSILHFYTFLLINCNNELVLCKIVSDSFVVELTQVYLDRLAKNLTNNRVDVQQINSYKIALIKAYVSRINDQNIKYMIINDRMRVFQNCVHLYEQYMKVEENEQFGVEATCISNCLLMIVRYFAEHPQYAPNICYQQNEKGVGYLLILIVEKIHNSMLGLLKQSGMDQQKFEFLKDRILFMIDIVNSITSEEYKQRIISSTSHQLSDLRELFKQIVLNHAIVQNQNQTNYMKNVELIRVLLKLLGIYFSAEDLLPLFQQTIIPILHRFFSVFRTSCTNIIKKTKELSELEQILDIQKGKLHQYKTATVSIFCTNMEILAEIIASGKYLSRRNSSHKKERELKNIITNHIIDVMQLLLSEEGEPIQDMICFKSVKFILLSLMQLTVGEHMLHEYSVVKFHQFAITKLKKYLKNSTGWDYVVLNYQYILKAVSQNLINIQDLSPLQYAFCQFHDLNKTKSATQLDFLINSLHINECARNFRFMMVEMTTVDQKDIKLQKNYHSNFISTGWNLEPGKEITNEDFQQICQLIHFSKGVKIPIAVMQDEECLLFVLTELESRKVILNIRFKSIQGFSVQKDVVHIRLKGLQQILVEPPLKYPKESIVKFKEYLILKRNKSRQRELKFIHHYLEIYYQDNLRVIQKMGQNEIQDGEEIKEQQQELLPNETIVLENCKSLKGSNNEVLSIAKEQQNKAIQTNFTEQSIKYKQLTTQSLSNMQSMISSIEDDKRQKKISQELESISIKGQQVAITSDQHKLEQKQIAVQGQRQEPNQNQEIKAKIKEYNINQKLVESQVKEYKIRGGGQEILGTATQQKQHIELQENRLVQKIDNL